MGDELVTVGTYSEPNEAQLAKAMLEMNGIPAFVTDVQSSVYGWLGTADDHLRPKVQVAESQAGAAKALLASKGARGA